MAYEGDYRKRIREVAGEVDRPLNLICYDMDRSHSFLSDVINGRQNMKVDDLEVFCSVVGIDPADFFGSDRNKTDLWEGCSPVCVELICEEKKCDDVFLRTILSLVREFNGRSKQR